LKEEGLEVVRRSVVAFLTIGAIAVIPLGSAVVSPTTAKAIVYVSGGNLWTIGARQGHRRRRQA
jgi:hypothetical protein